MITSATRGIWLAITVIAGAMIGTAAGVIAWIGGTNPPTAILTGGGGFAGATLLILTMLRFAASTGTDD